MSILFSVIKICYLMLEFTYTVNFCDFSSKGLNSGPMTEQKTRDAKSRHVGVTPSFRRHPQHC